MNYLIVSCTTYDMAGRAMIQGAINAISQLDKHAHFVALHRPEHNYQWIGWYKEPNDNEEAFQWADVILDIAGLHTNQGNKYEWKRLREKYNKPYIFMPQSFMQNPDPKLFENTYVIARGELSRGKLAMVGVDAEMCPDLSFLVKDYHDVGITAKRVFSTHFCKNWERMKEYADINTDLQIIEKLPQGDQNWEPSLDITAFHGTPEQVWSIVKDAEEVHTSRFQIACAAIRYGIEPKLYMRGNEDYDEKYIELLLWYHAHEPDALIRIVNETIEDAYEWVLDFISRQ